MWDPKLKKDEWYFDEGCLVMDSQRRKQSEGPNDLLLKMVAERCFTKDMVWRRIIGRRDRRVDADKKKIWDNWGFFRICCACLNILKISWATGIGFSWFFLGWKANFQGYDSYKDHFFIFCLYNGGEGWEVVGPKLTKDEGYFDKGCLVMDSQRRKQSDGPNDLLWELVGEESFTKDMLWRRISGRRGRRVEAYQKKIWDNRSFVCICCTGLSILKISCATGIGLSWIFLCWKANF